MVDDKKNKIEFELQKILKNPIFYAIYYFLKYILSLDLTENTKKNYKSKVFTGIKGILDTDEIKDLKDKINNK